MSPPQIGLPSFSVSQVAKVLMGEQPCLLAPWLAGHVRFIKRPNDDPGSLVRWKSSHTDELQRATAAYRATGWRCTVESFFTVTGQSARLVGKADLICQKADERPVIVDIKTGAARESDTAQVLIEMIAIPMAWGQPAVLFNGLVWYSTANRARVHLTPDDATAFKPKLFAMVKQLGTMDRPLPNPSQSACRFCDVPDSECSDRWRPKDDPSIVVSEW